MANCRDFTYIIAFTDNGRALIQLEQNALKQDFVDIALVGKTRLAYGEVFNENILHILEHFASSSATPTPNTSNTVPFVLENPTFGQAWYNKQLDAVFAYTTDGVWKGISGCTKTIGNSGTILHGEYIPLPLGISDYSKCQIIVTPFWFNGSDVIDSFNVSVDADGLVTATYVIAGTEYFGHANYMILSIEGAPGGLTDFCVIPLPSPTPTPTITNSPSSTPAPGSSAPATATPTPTPTITNSPSSTPAPGSSAPATATPVPTPTRTPTREPSNTPVPLSPGASQPVTPTPDPTSTPASTPPVTQTPQASQPSTPPATPPETPAVTPTPSPEIIMGAWGLISTTCQEVLEVEDLPQVPCTSENAGQILVIDTTEGVGDNVNCSNTFECIVT